MYEVIKNKNNSHTFCVRTWVFNCYSCCSRNGKNDSYDCRCRVRGKNNALPNENVNLPPEVLALKPTVEKVAKEMSIPDEVPYLLAIIMVESGGRGGDPFQSSESAGLPPNTITSPEQSIRQGVTHYKSCLDLANQYSIQDRKAVLQAYNYGGGF